MALVRDGFKYFGISNQEVTSPLSICDYLPKIAVDIWSLNRKFLWKVMSTCNILALIFNRLPFLFLAYVTPARDQNKLAFGLATVWALFSSLKDLINTSNVIVDSFTFAWCIVQIDEILHWTRTKSKQDVIYPGGKLANSMPVPCATLDQVQCQRLDPVPCRT